MASGRRLAFLYACPNSVLDTSSGAAFSVRTLLIALAARGHGAAALQATVFDSDAAAASAKAAQAKEHSRVLRIEDKGVEHFVVPTQSRRRGLMIANEQETFFAFFRNVLETRRPDVVLTWGGRLLEMALRDEARRRGVAVVFVLANGLYRRASTFANADLLVTESPATAALYEQRLGLDVKSIGKLVDPAQFKAAARTPRFITFLNPQPEKGVALFATLARRARAELPEAEFLVVEGRGTWQEAVDLLRLDPNDFGNIHVSPMTRDLKTVYANTRVLLVPSLWHESGPRVVPEALLNGIPVLGARSGGIPEGLAGSGYTFETPPAVQSNWNALAPDEAVTPWLDVLKRLVRDEAFYAEESKKALEASKHHDLDRSVSNFLDAVTPLVGA